MAKLIHDTIRHERLFDAPVGRVFEAWRSSAALAQWSCPGDDGWSGHVEANDFRVGGEKRVRFGPDGEPPFHEESRYLAIAPDAHIVNSERILRGDTLISTSLISLEFETAGEGCRLAVTDQITLFDAADMPEQRREGWGEVLDKLAGYLAA